MSRIQLSEGLPGNTPGFTNAPAWWRNAWKGVQMFVEESAHDPDVYTTSTKYAIGRLAMSNRGAAYLWQCCLAWASDPTMSFSKSLCTPIVQSSSGGGMGG